jgi:hypothetical protein
VFELKRNSKRILLLHDQDKTESAEIEWSPATLNEIQINKYKTTSSDKEN